MSRTHRLLLLSGRVTKKITFIFLRPPLPRAGRLSSGDFSSYIIRKYKILPLEVHMYCVERAFANLRPHLFTTHL